jgi:outer membrane protein assembly factor BamB
MTFRIISRLVHTILITVIASGLANAVAAPQPANDFGFQTPQTKTPDGIRMVANPLQPRDGVQKPKYTREWSVGGDSDPQGNLINRPFDVRVAKDGSVYVLDLGDTCIRQFDAKGKFVRQIGRSGQGPGEYNAPMYFDVDAGNQIFVVDGQNLRVTCFDKDGKPLNNFRVEKFCTQIRADGRGRLFLGETSSIESDKLTSEFKEMVQKLTILRTDPDGGNALRIGPFIGQKFMIKAQGQGAVSLSSHYSPLTGWGIAPDGRLYVGYNGEYEISAYDPDGKILFRFGREYQRQKIKSSRPGAKGPEYFPAFAPDFFFDDAGNIWLRQFNNENDKDSLYDVFSPEGIYLKQIVAPFRIYQVRNGKVYAIVETDEGFKTLSCFRME